jgi:GT2 family glycosyltransferase/glycosyltransferase involved in cell wall biosynthesis
MILTVLVATKNSGDTLNRTLKGIFGLPCKVLIVDDFSSDNTTKIARGFKYKIESHRADGFELQRTYALNLINTEWVLILDSDEVLKKINIDEIKIAIKKNEYDGFYLFFRNHLFGNKLTHGELHRKLVLFKIDKLNFVKTNIHEQCQVEGTIGELPSEIDHYSYRSISQVITKFFDYAFRLAKQYKYEERKYNWEHLLLYPLHMFYARFIKDEGYKDGPARLFLDLQFAQMEFLSYFLIPFVNAKPRVAVDCGAYPAGGMVQSGIDRLIQGIYNNQHNDYDYYWFGFVSKAPHKLPQFLFSKLWMPLAIIFNRADIFLGVSGYIPPILKFFSVKKILFLYDFGFYTSEEKYVGSAKRLQNQTNKSVQIADKIILLNEEAYKEFIHRFPSYAYKAELIVSGADHLNKVEEKPVFVQPKTPLILYVGVVKPVKQIDKLISAVGDSYCVIAGPQEEQYKKSLKIGKTQNIQFIKNLHDGQLKWMYTHADIMAYTSAHEGFCYPVLEALISGLPVVAFELLIFKKYQTYFPYLTLVKTEEEMKEKIREITAEKKRYEAPMSHPYTWEAFSKTLIDRIQFNHLPRPVGKKTAVIVVLYNTSLKEQKRLEEEIKNIDIANYKVYWIDNSGNGKGYAAGINEGVRQGLIDGCEEFIALNPDISLKGITVEQIVQTQEEFDIWGLTMKQNGKVYYGGEIDTWRLSGGLTQKKPDIQLTEVDFVTGSLIGFSRDVILGVGLFDESYFMYYEDVDYCKRAKMQGFQIGINRDVTYEHFEVSQTNKQKEKWIAKSRWKFFWKYSNWKQKIREIVRLPKTLQGA